MRTLVTGGGGFIGSNVVEALLHRGDDVIVLDDFSTGRRENLKDAPAWAATGGGSFTLVEDSIRDVPTVRRLVEDRDVVFHIAALPSVARSVLDPLASHVVNVDGTLNVLLAARDFGVRRFVFSSSSSLYGESKALPKVETMPSDPISPYGLDKLAGETYCRLFHRLYGLHTVALRYFNVFGPRQNPASEYAAVIPKFVTAALEKRPATIYGDGRHTRDFTYVDNVVEANLLAANAADDACGQAYNIACGERTSLLDLNARIGALAGSSIPPEHQESRPGDIQHSLAGVEKAAKGLGFRARVSLEQGLERTVAWYRGQLQRL